MRKHFKRYLSFILAMAMVCCLFQIGNEAKAGNTIECNEIEIGFDKVDSNGIAGVYLTATSIASGPNAGSALSNVYGSWEKVFTGNVVFKLKDNTEKEVSITQFGVISSGLYVNLAVQNPAAQVDISNVDTVTFNAGTVLTENNNGSSLPIKITKELTLKNLGSDWEVVENKNTEYNEVQLKFSKVDPNGIAGIYLTTTSISLGPNAGSSLSSVYGSWEKVFTGTVVFKLKDSTEKEVSVTQFGVISSGVYVNLAVQNPAAQVDITNVDTVTFKAGAVLTENNNGDSVPIKIASDLTLKNIGNGWQTVEDTDGGTGEEPGGNTGGIPGETPEQNPDGNEGESNQPVKKGKARVILLAGQSNATGISSVSHLAAKADAADYARYQSGYDNILIRYEVDDNTNASDAFVSVTLGQGYTTGHFGPEVGIADYLSKKYPGETFYIIKSSWSGTYLSSDWQTDSDVYKKAIERTNKSFKMLEDSGLEPELFAFCWMQGEGDAGSQFSAEDYYNQLSNLVARIFARYNKYATPSGIAFVDGGISDMYQWKYHEIVNAAKQKYASEKPNRYYLDTQAENLSYQLENNDPAHYDALSMIRLGEMFGEAVGKAYEKGATK